MKRSIFLSILGFAFVVQSASADVGRTEGSASVSAAGEATYTVPIIVPPGINGLTPELALTYSHRKPEGIAGVGWGLTGLSVLTRCPKTQAQDGAPDGVDLEITDRFCLDGNQLRLTSGTYGVAGSQYRTEVDMIARITANGTAGNGPASFKIESKDGLIYDYGSTSNSRIESLAIGYQTTARVWALNQISDRAGNFISISYEEDGAPFGTYRPTLITYGRNVYGSGTDEYAIDLFYESQPPADVDTSYATNGVVEDKKRLYLIEVRYGNPGSGWPSKLGTYEIDYELNLSSADRSRLSSITRCGSTPGPADCLDPISFTYQNGTNNLATEVSSGSSIPSGTSPLAIDINGDGRTDVVYPSASTGGTWMFRLANSSGGYGAATSSGISSSGHSNAIAFDHDSDGLEDILVPYSGSTWWAIHGTATGLSGPVNTLASHSNSPGDATALDLNGDGRDDLVWAQTGPNSNVWVNYRSTSGNGFETTILVAAEGFRGLTTPVFRNFEQNRARGLDVNGDGYQDVGYFQRIFCGRACFIYYLKFTLGNNQGTLITTGGPNGKGLPIDLNGDGYTDVTYQLGTSLYTKISTGKTFGTTMLVGSYSNMDWSNAVVLDWSGDGMEDLVIPNTSTATWHLAESDGFKLTAPVNTGLSSSSPINAFATDSNGDGLHDIGYVRSDNSYVHRPHSGVEPDLLTDVVDGNDNTVNYYYSTLADSSVYTKGSNAVLPMVDYLLPIYVVNRLEMSTGTATTYTVDYRYENLQINIEGRGNSGFGTRIVTDNRTGNAVTEYYHVDFPYRGLLQQKTLHLSDETLVQETTNTWSTKDGGTGYQQYHFPYIAQTTEENYEAEGIKNSDQMNTITTTSTVDVYGTAYDITTVTTEHTDANGAQPGVSFTQRTYTPNLHNISSSWCLGRPTQVQQISSHTGPVYGASTSRTTDHVWDTSSNCRVTQSIIEPQNTNYKLTTTFEYDGYGNVDKETVTGVDAGVTMVDRVTERYWGMSGLHLKTVTNALNQTTTLGWSDNGDLLSVTDPNGLVISWLYDDFGRRTRETNPDNTYSTYSFITCDSGNAFCGTNYSLVKTQVKATSWTIGGVEIRNDNVFLDAYDRNIETSSQTIGGGMSSVRVIYDELGRIKKQSSPTLSTATLHYSELFYDNLGRPTQLSRPINDGTSTLQHSYTYYEGLTTKFVDAESHETSTVQDALGRVHQSHDDLSHYQQFDFDAIGSVRRVQDCVLTNCTQLVTMTYVYGADAFQLSSDDISLGDWTYSFNSHGEMTAFNDARTGGRLPSTATATYTYDKLGRPLTRIEPEGTTTWTWGTSAALKNIGRLASISSPGHSQSFTYDSAGRLQQHSRTGGGTYDIDYVYNSVTGLLDSIQYPAITGGYRFKVLQEYDYGLLKRVKRSDADQTVFWEAQAQDAFGNVIDEDFGNGVTTIRGFDGVTGSIDYIQTNIGATDHQDLAYSWDKVGNLLYRKDWLRTGNPTEDFSYDALNRLRTSDITGAAAANFEIEYHENGNIKSKDDISPNDWTYHSTKKHAVATAGTNTYGYDANGNMNSRKGDPITWTSYNYPSEIVDGLRTYDYSYDAFRQKWKQIYDNNSSVETTYYAGRLFAKNVHSSDTEHRHFIMANGRAVAMLIARDQGTDYYRYFLQDHLGSTDAIITSGGGLDVAESFSAWGERRDPIDWVGSPGLSDKTTIAGRTDRGYTDHISLEESSLVHMNGRVYDAEIGRFLSPDPFVTNAYNTQAFNRYTYVHNNPARYTDPTGFCIDGTIVICIDVLGSLLNFIFDSDDKPPHDDCKDNTGGCGPVATDNEEIVTDNPSLPNERTDCNGTFGCVDSGPEIYKDLVEACSEPGVTCDFPMPPPPIRSVDDSLVIPGQVICHMGCHGIDYSDRRYANDQELIYIDLGMMAIDLAIPLPPIYTILKGSRLVNAADDVAAFGTRSVGAAQRVPQVLQTGGQTISRATADALNSYAGTNLARRDVGRALEALKREKGLPNLLRGSKILDNGDLLDDAGNLLGNIIEYFP